MVVSGTRPGAAGVRVLHETARGTGSVEAAKAMDPPNSVPAITMPPIVT
ncbi:hypothetical protein TOK_0043 [Pseudonocardia sp. N23]|nr:hypothetical protein TOK_0043 [Pseudonocardia sp. N23]